jgi:cation diffusion facilitator CzcD-associated flavoprotein CzcO
MEYEFIILGAGFSGLCLAAKLKQKGHHNFIILEKEESIGGTWFCNNYPGAECDVESHLYSFSFFPNSDWKQVYSKRADIYKYLQSFCEHYDLYKHIKLDSKVVKACFDKQKKCWFVYSEKETYKTRYFAYSYSPLHHPYIPQCVKSFRGTVIHTSAWDHSIDLKGKNIGIIGNAASGIQCIPYLAEQASQLYIFQRTPNWIMSKWNRNYSRFEKIFFRVAWIQKMYRNYIYWSRECFFTIFYNKWTQKIAEYIIQARLWFHPRRNQLIPDYPIGCKRILLCDDYWKTLCKDNVSLLSIDELKVEAYAIQNLPADVLVCATGFDLQGSVKNIEIIGKNNIKLDNVWDTNSKDYFRNFLGIYVDNFPNMFVLLGPNTGSAHTSIILYIEAQCDNILEAVKFVEKFGSSTIEVSPKKVTKYLQWVDKQFEDYVWNSCNSWYVNNGGKNVSLFPGFHYYYDWMLRNHSFRGFIFN